jgi:Nuclease-related domain
MKHRSSTSPIKDPPLRLPAQSLVEERSAILNDKLEPWLAVAVFMLALACFEWYRYFSKIPPNPVVFSIAAVVAATLAAWRFFRLRPRLRRLRQAIDGEKAVGQFLERLRESRYVVFHDVVGEGFNVDHVLIGPAGVFTVETKTWSKPAGGDARITFDGDTLKAGPHTPDRDPVVQAKAQASWLRRTLAESTGRQIDVFPVVLFPGWYVEQAPATRDGLWLLEPKALPAFLEREPTRLPLEDRKLVEFHLSRFIRAGERQVKKPG